MTALKRTNVFTSHVLSHAATSSSQVADKAHTRSGDHADKSGESGQQGDDTIHDHILKQQQRASQSHKRVGIEFAGQDLIAVSSRRRATVQWQDPIRRVLLVKKHKNKHVTGLAREVASWLCSVGVVIFVEAADISEYEGIPGISVLRTDADYREAVDLVVSLGGDGTLLHASRLFRFLERCVNKLLPPCLVLGAGSLGFLATVPASEWKSALTSALYGNVEPVPCTLRTRLRCSLESPIETNANSTISPWYALNEPEIIPWYGLNECVVLSRGNAIGKLQVFVDGALVTLVEGDGIIISSPTGSTGYSLSCGGPIVSPSVPCTLLTPIAPASLSFRPLLISEMSTVEIVLPPKARVGTADVIVDGREMGKLQRGGKVVITVARPIPILNVAGLDSDWFEAINTKLKWNARDVEQEDIEQ